LLRTVGEEPLFLLPVNGVKCKMIDIEKENKDQFDEEPPPI
jgi:hypothetical protein